MLISDWSSDVCTSDLGGRRDEEKARAKERVYSHRDEFGQWDPKMQRPELWSLYNGKIREGEHMRIFPLSNWTELDIWHYIHKEQIEIPSIYFSHEREIIERPEERREGKECVRKCRSRWSPSHKKK